MVKNEPKSMFGLAVAFVAVLAIALGVFYPVLLSNMVKMVMNR